MNHNYNKTISMKATFLFPLMSCSVLMCPGLGLKAQVAPVPVSEYRVLAINSQSAADTVGKAFDGDTSTWWAVNTAIARPLPAVLDLDLGKPYKVCGISYLCNPQNCEDKLSAYRVYVSNDTSDWGDAQAASRIYWPSSTDVAGKDLLFGAVEGRFVRVVYEDNANTWNNAVQTAELRVLASDTAALGRKNQILDVPALPALVSAADTTPLQASASSGLDVEFRIVSGPAEIERMDSVYCMVCQGEEGTAVVEAVQCGNGEFYPVSYVFPVEIQQPAAYGVQLYTPLVEDEPVVMPSDTLYYLLQARAEIGSEFAEITGVTFRVDGDTLDSGFDPETGLAQARFYPGEYGRFNVIISAHASNGRDTSLSRFITVDSARESRTVRAFEHLLINYPDPGRTNGGVYVFPQHVGSYRSIVAKLDVQCPEIEGDCDDWDRVAWVEIQTPDGQWREIIRYTTAYGVPCDHELDVTDFAAWLQGEVPMRMFVDTWGTGGYDVTLDFEFDKGMPQYLYTGITPLWNGNFMFGDPANLQPLDTLDVKLGDGIAALDLKVVTTGHGWGGNNTGNAAEFYQAEHHLYANEEVFEHVPWMQCIPNPDDCTGQRGTWYHNRAGWCPGAIAPGYHYNLTALAEDERLQMKFIFEEGYVDECHPNNPECVSGVTCTDCMDTYNPQYYIASYLVSYYDKMYDSLPDVANERLASREELHFTAYPNPATDRFFVQTYGETGRGTLQVIGLDGKVWHNYMFNSGVELNGMEFPVWDMPQGVYVVRIQTEHKNGIYKIVVQ